MTGNSSRWSFLPLAAAAWAEAKTLDYEDLAKEVDFLERCGVHGMVWPQMASECAQLTKPKRQRGPRNAV